VEFKACAMITNDSKDSVQNEQCGINDNSENTTSHSQPVSASQPTDNTHEAPPPSDEAIPEELPMHSTPVSTADPTIPTGSFSEDLTNDLEEEHPDEPDKEQPEKHDNTPRYVPEAIDYAKLSKEDLVKVLKDLINSGHIIEIKREIDQIKTHFYKKHKAEIDEIRQQFLTEGGAIQDFKVEETPVEAELKELLNKYRNLRSDISQKQEDEKENNLRKKYEIIEKIKELVTSQESLNKTFHEFRDLQNQWRDIGPVPQQSIKELWDSYHYQVEGFYDYIKINKELRDLDFRKNLDAKIRLCELAEELLLEPSVVDAFRKLQKLHDQWREIGPIPADKRAEMWERFKEVTANINKKHQEYFVELKQQQKKNYDEKLVLCERAEAILAENPDNHSDWEKNSKDFVALQEVWKTIGFAPKKYNTQIYDRFRKACDAFFVQKREFYSQNREEQSNNYQLKTELCMQAEAIMNSTDWKKTTAEFIALQKKWKAIGPVNSKNSDKIWKRFRAACDTFFNNKAAFYDNIDSSYEDNMNKKKQLIEEIEKYEFSSDVEKNLKSLKDFQRRWSEIGFVPIQLKNEIQEHYRAAINNKFDQLKVDDDRKSLIKFRNRLEGMKSKTNSDRRMNVERDKCFTKMKQLENDITLWENNIGFFANSKNAEAMIRDVRHKIEDAKHKIEQLKDKIRMLDSYED